MDADDGVSQQGSHAKHLGGNPRDFGLRSGVGGNELLDAGLFKPFDGDGAEDGVRNADIKVLGPVLAEDFHRRGDGAGGLGDVVHQEDVFSLHIADDVGRFGVGGVKTLLAHNGEAAVHHLAVGGGHFHAADVRGDRHQVGDFFLHEVFVENRGGEEVVHRDVEESLDLLGMEVNGEHAVHPGGHEEVGDQFGGDGDAGLVLAVLAGVAEKGEHGGDPVGGGAAGGIHHDQQLHQVLVGGGAGGLNDKDVIATDVIVKFDEGFAVRKGRHSGFAERNLDLGGNPLRQFAVRVAGKDLQLVSGNGRHGVL